MGPFARVAVARPVQGTFHYRIPQRLRAAVQPGCRCVVPFGRATVAGFVIALDATAPVHDLREVLEVLDPEPCLPSDLLALGLWLAAYYHHPPGETLSTLLPPAFRATATAVYRPGPAAETVRSARGGEAALLELVRAQGELPAAQVPRTRVGALDRLVAAGALVRAWQVAAPTGPRGQPWFALTDRAPEPCELTRAPRQATAVVALGTGALPGWVLRERGVSAAVLRRLQALGWVRRWEGPPRPTELGRLATHGGEAVERLTAEQQGAIDQATRGLDAAAFAVLLLQGVTGSGKTEVYIRAAREALRRGMGALVLVPEIALTPQLMGRFAAAFGDRVTLLHSGLGNRDRALQWGRLLRGEAAIAVGARSAVFAPVVRLGLVVVDEEHEAAYKQEEGLRYHAKHAALVRARHCGALAILGSATPDVESYWAGDGGRYRHLRLTRRVAGALAPRMVLADVRQEEGRRRRPTPISEPLRRAVDEALGRQEQVLLFLNRRGFSPALLCRSCGQAVGCRRCSIALTLHRRGERSVLVCHYCGHQRPLPRHCPDCPDGELSTAGVGTQQLVQVAAELWPETRILRLDRDTARGGGAQVLGAFHRGEAEILVGTQMVAKGHHFPRLSVVGVVDADRSLHFPDFRAGERTFQLLTQVAGRAGRGEVPGLAVLQTRNPHHPVLAAVVAADYEAFAAAELEARREAGFPPFRRLAMLRYSALSDAECRRAASAAARRAGEVGHDAGVEVLGPAPAPVERIRGRWRYQVLLRGPGPEPGPLQAVLRTLVREGVAAGAKDFRAHVDIDPVSML